MSQFRISFLFFNFRFSSPYNAFLSPTHGGFIKPPLEALGTNGLCAGVLQNVQSIGSAFNNLQILTSEQRADILVVTEDWESYDENKAYQVNGYNLVSSYCCERGEHRGCAIYCTNRIVCVHLPTSEFEKLFERANK
ncbi:hypothetical protein WA026_020064 [Henosepilachna vigintioctopunctata]|uniref:Uncharacterized protein n=1 Tax=Henosepilachna vigintioctopunctata TaxID=420089 RepID=A0AAW1UD43_9CUCU